MSWNMWKLRPKLLPPVAVITLRISPSSCSAAMVAPARKPKPPAWVVAITRLASETQPIAVCTIG
ncbi:hypothetical protein D3C85_1883920 [compost metagenome]